MISEGKVPVVTPNPVLLTHSRSPGDIVCMTAAVRDLQMTYPGEFDVYIRSECPELWMHNPHIAGHWQRGCPRELRSIRVDCKPEVNQANTKRLHYVTAFHRAISRELHRPIPVLQPHGDLHLSDDERHNPPDTGRYWFFVAGGKSDITTKIWSPLYSQALVDLLRARDMKVVQGGADYPGHKHPQLEGVHSVVGETSLRDFIRWIYHADGVICPVTFAMHVAAAFQKPCVVIAGGREPYWWEQYADLGERHFGKDCGPIRIPHRFLHTVGRLDCCLNTGCWKTQVQAKPVGLRDCVLPEIVNDSLVLPKCLQEITPTMVAQAVGSYYADGTLEPVG